MSLLNGSITNRLIAVLTLCSLLILGVGLGVDYRLSRAELLSALELEANEAMTALMVDLENLLDGVESATGLLARLLQHREHTPEELRRMLRDAIEYNDDVFGGSIALLPSAGTGPYAPYYFKARGTLRFADLTSTMPTYWERPWFADAIDKGAPAWSEPYFDEGGGEVWMTTYTVPIYRYNEQGDRSPMGVVTADVTLEELQDYLRRLRPGANGYGIMLDREGRMLSARDTGAEPRVLSAQAHSILDGSGSALSSLESGQELVRRFPCPRRDGECTLRLKLLQSTGWPVGVVYSEREALAPLRAYELKTALIGLATLLLMAVAVALVTKRMTRPLSALAVATERIAQGELRTPLPRTASKDEIARLVDSFGSMQRDLSSYLTDLRTAEAMRGRLEGELDAARDIQMAMLPGSGNVLQCWPELCLWACVEPARSVGGDLYYFARIDDSLYLAIGDVSDKGAPAALFMAGAMSLLQQLLATHGSPQRVISQLNDALASGNQNCMFITLFLGRLDCTTLRMHFSSAGHGAPLVLRNGQVRTVDQIAGPALALASGIEFADNVLQLRQGDRLTLYTDGIDEAFNAQDQQFGLDALKSSIADSADANLRRAGVQILSDVKRHSADTAQSDDRTLLLLQAGTPDHTLCGESQVQLVADRLSSSAATTWIRQQLVALGTPTDFYNELMLVAEEVVTNIQKYADLPAGAQLNLSLQWDGQSITLIATDSGRPFNPLREAIRAKRGDSTEAATIGGLGVHLITQLTDEQHYRYSDGCNELRLQKILPGELDSSNVTGVLNREPRTPMELNTSVTLDEQHSVARVLLSGALNTETAPAFEQLLQEVVQAGHALIVLDMKELDYISSAGLRVIFKAAKDTSADGRRLAAANRKPHIDKVFEILKALPDMSVFANDEELDSYLTDMQEKTKGS
ncbi:MAG: anti-sigma factor antagonist [Pseudomonadota bacterium]